MITISYFNIYIYISFLSLNYYVIIEAIIITTWILILYFTHGGNYIYIMVEIKDRGWNVSWGCKWHNFHRLINQLHPAGSGFHDIPIKQLVSKSRGKKPKGGGTESSIASARLNLLNCHLYIQARVCIRLTLNSDCSIGHQKLLKKQR